VIPRICAVTLSHSTSRIYPSGHSAGLWVILSQVKSDLPRLSSRHNVRHRGPGLLCATDDDIPDPA